MLVVLIHGLPETGAAPLDQLAAARDICDSRGFAVAGYRWAAGTLTDFKAALHLLESETESFTEQHARGFQKWLQSEPAVSKEDGLVVVAYSAGGAILYRWMCEIATPDQVGRLAMAIMIASPHTVPSPMYLEKFPNHPLLVNNERVILPTDIVKMFVDSDTQLRVLLGGCDITVPVEYGMFPGLEDERQHVIRFATHSSICTHPQAKQRLRTWLGQAFSLDK